MPRWRNGSSTLATSRVRITKSPASMPGFFNLVSPSSYFAGVFFATKPSSGL